MIQGEIKEKEETIPSGVEDGGEVELRCESCGLLQMTVLRSRPTLDFEGYYKCKCYDCGNFTNTEYIKGGTSFIYPGDETKRICFNDGFNIINGVMIFKMKKDNNSK